MNYMLDARCPECENVAKVNDELTKVTCPHCKFEKTYDEYLEIEIISFIRSDEKFKNRNLLKEQIKKDVNKINKLLD